MKKIKDKASKVAAVGLISMLSLGGLASAAFADELSHADPQTHKESMVIDGDISVINHNDINNDGLVNAGDTFDLNLHIENTSDNDYNYVDVSSFGLDLNREFVSDSLPSGESVDYAITYEIKESDTLTDTVSHNIFVNVRDETRIENSTSISLFESVDMNEDVVEMSNSKLTGLIMDKDTGNVVVYSIDEYDNYYGIDESRLTEDYHRASVGDGYVYAFDFTNDTEEAITLDSIQYVDNIIEENISGTVVEPGETANLYAISEITRDDMDWGLVNSKATVGGSFDVVVSDTNGVNYSISAGSTTNTTTPADLMNWGDSNVEDLGGTAEANITYTLTADDNSATVVVDGVSSETFGFIESNHILTDANEVIVDAPEAIVLESGESFEENAFVVHRGLYHSSGLYINAIQTDGSYTSDSGGGLGDEFPAPTLSNPVCDEEAQVVLPQEFIDQYNEENYIPYDMELLTYEVEKQDDNTYYVYAVDWNYPMIVNEWTLEIPEVVPCPVVEVPAPEVPVFIPETCDSDSSVNLPENSEFYTYEQSIIDGVHTVNAVLVETGEIAETWSFDVVEATDCAIEPPVVEIPDYEEPVFTAPTCDDPASLETPESNEFYNYFAAGFETTDGVGGFTVEVRNAETDEVLDSWEFEYTNPTDCDPVVEIPEPEVPVFVPATCDDSAFVEVPDRNEFYEYTAISVIDPEGYGEIEVIAVSVETGENVANWTFDIVPATGCDPVVPDVPVVEPPVVEVVEPPVEEEVLPPVINDPKPPVKVDSGEVSEVNTDDNNVAVFALIAGAGALVALAAGGVLVRSRNK